MPLYPVVSDTLRGPYDVDGTGVFVIDGTTLTRLDATTTSLLNRETGAASVSIPAGGSLLFWFPWDNNSRQINLCRGALLFGPGSNSFTSSFSMDTTDGFNGTWNTTDTGALIPASSTAPSAYYRIDPQFGGDSRAVSAGGVQMNAIKFTFASAATVQSAHLSYFPTRDGSGSTTFPFLAVTNGALPFSVQGYRTSDWGDVSRNSVAPLAPPLLFVTNFCSTLSANNVVLSIDAPTGGSTSGASEHQLRYNGGAWASTITIPTIGSYSTSAGFEVRRNTSSTALLGSWVYRVKVTAGTWT